MNAITAGAGLAAGIGLTMVVMPGLQHKTVAPALIGGGIAVGVGTAMHVKGWGHDLGNVAAAVIAGEHDMKWAKFGTANAVCWAGVGLLAGAAVGKGLDAIFN